MGREYCQHMVRIDDDCLECQAEAIPDFWECARAWAGLAMWLECYWTERDLTDNAWCQGWRAAVEHFEKWEEGWTFGERERCRAWQALRDWLDGTAEQWMEKLDEEYNEGFAEGFAQGFGSARGKR